MTLLDSIKQVASAKIDDATGLPFAAYSDNEVYQLEMDNIFRNDWVFVCNEGEVAKPGDYYALTIADEPIIIIRGRDGELRAMSNVCRHRGTPLNDEGFGNKGRMVCPYHAWTYTDTGKLIGVPHPGTIAVEKSDHCLPHFKLESWNGLLFVNINGNAEPLKERYAGIDKYLKRYNIGSFTEGSGGENEYWNSNWKLAIENGIESYHLFKVHQETLELNTPTREAFYIEGKPDWTLTGGNLVGESRSFTESAMMALMPKATQRLYEHYVLFSLPPNFVGILLGDSLGYLSVIPVDAENSIIRAGTISSSKINPGKSEQEFVEAFFAEDKWICERNQKSMKSRHGQPGKLVELEQVVVDFHHYLAERLFDLKIDSHIVDEKAKPLMD
ncbi:aromatic ring-hydroxylating oxygenase subunit alpha [Pseudoteredinibacter isoporae]|uniref:aromatic ring-hydroxylating oxygenase subunit alpha n=1 Tax=Pseudoteredinibacter isoporae TaxID=570281 RepID=UPI003104341E